MVKALVEEGLGGGEDDTAIDVVLDMLECLVADPHRPHAAVAGKAVDLMLGQSMFEGAAIDRLKMAVRRRGDDIGDVAQIVLHGLGGAQAVQRMDDEIGIPQPAEPVVPVALGIRNLGDRGRHRRDDRPAFLEVAQL